MLVEIGGTVGDIEGLPFFEAIRQLGQDLPRGDTSVTSTSPCCRSSRPPGEMKTKPTQHSVKELRSIGIQPDILLCRCEQPIPPEEQRKIGLFCNVRPSAVIEAMDADSIYAVPLAYHRQGLDLEVLDVFGLRDAAPPIDLSRWSGIADKITHPDGEVTIAVVGKYTLLKDAYKSMIEALVHGGLANRVKVNLDWVEAESFEGDHGAAATRLEGSTASWSPAPSANAGRRARSAPCSSRANGLCRSSASVSACRWR